MDLGLTGKVALVTAASQGLGKAVAQALAAEGCRLALCARHSDALEKAAEGIQAETGAEVLAVPADVSAPAEVSRLVTKVADHYGRLDVLVVNAGGPPPGDFLDLDEAAWRRGVDLTLMSAVNLCYAAVPHMRAAGGNGGRIIAITSLSVRRPLPNLVLSNSLRLAVLGLLKHLSNELAPYNILVNAVLPGWTRTERVGETLEARAAKARVSIDEIEAQVVGDIPLGRMARPEELGAVVAFLASARASYVTGAAIPVDGGAIQSPV